MQPGDMVMPALWWAQFYEIVEPSGPDGSGINLDGGYRLFEEDLKKDNIWLAVDEKIVSNESWVRVLFASGDMAWVRRKQLVIFDENNVPPL